MMPNPTINQKRRGVENQQRRIRERRGAAAVVPQDVAAPSTKPEHRSIGHFDKWEGEEVLRNGFIEDMEDRLADLDEG